MRVIDADIRHANALVIDPNPTSRSVLAAMLREGGLTNIVQISKVLEARRTLEFRNFDFVLCEYHFEGESMTGQDLMADLRLAQLLPLSTVVVMISSESAYTKVAEAAEAALDAYLIKPHTEQALLDRLIQARARKKALKDVFVKIEEEALVEAAELCQVRFDTRGPAWLPAARIGAELWLRLGKPHAAEAMFSAILKCGALPWAQLGIARSQYESGSVLQSRRTLESLLSEQPGYADAYDIMGRVLLDQGVPQQALDSLRRACSITPGCVARLVKFGLLAFYYGEEKEAEEALQRAARLGHNSRTFDYQGLVLLAALQFDRHDARGLAQTLDTITKASEQQGGSARLRRFHSVIRIFKLLLDRSVPEAVQLTRSLLQEIQAPTFEFEAATNLLMMLTRLHFHEVRLDDTEHYLTLLARRFAVSHTTCELLARATQGLSEFEQVVRTEYAQTGATAEEAVSHTVAGRPRQAVLVLLEAAELSFNSKLIDLALHTLDRHRAAIEEGATLQARALELHRQYRSYGTQVQLAKADDPRLMGDVAKNQAPPPAAQSATSALPGPLRGR
ncbi:response regulator [Methylibium rhizosphaerae]|uniref:response regulator n=1 Tax=Methylibium rhizosphaerae TaxID=2570323 RepID=UPI0011295F73|nr:response regulator [Methylibium rhizosphaerae]